MDQDQDQEAEDQNLEENNSNIDDNNNDDDDNYGPLTLDELESLQNYIHLLELRISRLSQENENLQNQVQNVNRKLSSISVSVPGSPESGQDGVVQVDVQIQIPLLHPFVPWLRNMTRLLLNPNRFNYSPINQLYLPPAGTGHVPGLRRGLGPGREDFLIDVNNNEYPAGDGHHEDDDDDDGSSTDSGNSGDSQMVNLNTSPHASILSDFDFETFDYLQLDEDEGIGLGLSLHDLRGHQNESSSSSSDDSDDQDQDQMNENHINQIIMNELISVSPYQYHEQDMKRLWPKVQGQQCRQRSLAGHRFVISVNDAENRRNERIEHLWTPTYAQRIECILKDYLVEGSTASGKSDEEIDPGETSKILKLYRKKSFLVESPSQKQSQVQFNHSLPGHGQPGLDNNQNKKILLIPEQSGGPYSPEIISRSFNWSEKESEDYNEGGGKNKAFYFPEEPEDPEEEKLDNNSSKKSPKKKKIWSKLICNCF